MEKEHPSPHICLQDHDWAGTAGGCGLRKGGAVIVSMCEQVLIISLPACSTSSPILTSLICLCDKCIAT